MITILTAAVHETGHAVAVFVMNEMSLYDWGCPILGQVREVGINVRLFRKNAPKSRPLAYCNYIEWMTAPYGHHSNSQRPLYRDYATRLSVIRAMAGRVAEEQWRCRSRLGPQLLSAYLPAVVRTAGEQPTIGGNAVDFAKVGKWLGLLGCLDDDAEIRRLWDTARLLIAMEFPGIVRTARVLVTKKIMDGEQLEKVWRQNRPSEAIRLRLAQRMTGSTVEKMDWLRGEEAAAESRCFREKAAA
jgi:hypothetical protein